MDSRLKIIEELAILQKKETQERNVFKARAYAKVIQQLKEREKPVISIDDLKDVVGIGKNIKEKIEEIIRTGSLEQARLIKADSRVAIFETITNIYGIGPVKAKTLLNEYKISSIAELRDIVNKNPGILNEKQKIGLEYFEDLQERIPRMEMLQHQNTVTSLLRSIDNRMHCDIVGSFRRGEPSSGDIDVLIGYPDTMKNDEAQLYFTKFVKQLTTDGYITDVLALGPKKCMAVCKIGKSGKARRLDLLLTNAEEYPYALLYFTGSDKFNIQIRKRALERGYTLNEHVMKPVREGVPCVPFMQDEKAIFAFLDIEYVEPEKRTLLKKL